MIRETNRFYICSIWVREWCHVPISMSSGPQTYSYAQSTDTRAAHCCCGKLVGAHPLVSLTGLHSSFLLLLYLVSHPAVDPGGVLAYQYAWRKSSLQLSDKLGTTYGEHVFRSYCVQIRFFDTIHVSSVCVRDVGNFECECFISLTI